MLEIPLLEPLFTYEEVKNSSEQYLIITGIADKYRDRFQEYLVITGIMEKYQEQYMKYMVEHNLAAKYAGENGLDSMEIILS